MTRSINFCILVVLIGSCFGEEAAKEETTNEVSREGKYLPIFSIVSFKNAECRGTTAALGSARNGTCYTQSECKSKGGSTAGNCAAGFGVCCIFLYTATGTTITQNCSYIQNPSFPTVYSATTSLTYTVQKCATNVCSLRLDFETFTLLGPASTLEAATATCQDSFVLKGGSGITSPVICGKNTGQHLYTDLGSGSTGSATLTFTFSTTTSTVRTWEIKVTQIPCYSESRPPSGCLQYHQGLSGRLETFNFLESTTGSMMHLIDQQYSICIRKAAGYCCVQYSLCSDTYSYSLGNEATALTDSVCTYDFIGIAGASMECSTSHNIPVVAQLCGKIFNTSSGGTVSAPFICDCTSPFAVDIFTDATNDGTAPAAIAPARGLCLQYNQIPCGST